MLALDPVDDAAANVLGFHDLGHQRVIGASTAAGRRPATRLLARPQRLDQLVHGARSSELRIAVVFLPWMLAVLPSKYSATSA